MNLQLELMSMLNATNSYYKTPGTDTWDTATLSDAVFFHDTTKNIDFIFELNPETFTIKMWGIKNSRKVIVYTPTIVLGSRRFAPDIVTALHNLFTFNFASDATIVVQYGTVRKLPMPTPPATPQRASDAIIADPTTSSSYFPAWFSSPNSSNNSDSDMPSSSVLHRLFRRLLFLPSQ